MELTKERMLEITEQRETCDFCPDCGQDEICIKCNEVAGVTAQELLEYYDRVKQLLQADADGRCVVLPCKVGDTLYYLYRNNIRECSVDFISFEADGMLSVITRSELYHEVFCGVFKQEDFGKSVFLTRAEAEKALKGGAEDA